jgi:hypothetical protein
MRDGLNKYRFVRLERPIFPSGILLTVAVLILITIGCWLEGAK